MDREVFFLPAQASSAGGQRLCVYHGPTGEPRGAVLYLHPFAEEMNKSRRMAALQARALAHAGYAVLQIDLFGCGDSSGDFGDATWQDWLDDALLGCAWLQARVGDAHLTLWGLRAGALLATDIAARLHADGMHSSLLLWQPPASGKLLLQQFLRLKVASDLLGGQAQGAVGSLRRELAAGAPVEVGGYRLRPGLAHGLEHSVLAPCAGVRRIDWIEVSSREDAALSPASAALIEQWQWTEGLLSTHVVHGPAFWQTTEIEDAPALIAATLGTMQAVQDA